MLCICAATGYTHSVLFSYYTHPLFSKCFLVSFITQLMPFSFPLHSPVSNVARVSRKLCPFPTMHRHHHPDSTSSSPFSPAVNKIEHEDVRSYAQKYLNMGEWIMDNSIVFMSNSSYFVRNNGNNNDH